MQPTTKNNQPFSVFVPYFDSAGQQHLSEVYFSKTFKAVSDKLIATALDVGCGTGYLSYEFADRGVKVIALDSSKEMIRHAKHYRHHPNINYVHGDFLEFVSEPADLVICVGDTLNYISPDDLDKAFLQFSKLVKENGYLVLDYTRQLAYEQLDVFQTGEVRTMSMDEKTVHMRCGYSRVHKIATMTITIEPENVREIHHLYAHPDIAYSRLMREHGFKKISSENYNPIDVDDVLGFKGFVVGKKIGMNQ